jgi:hypothetical protein
VRFYILVPDIFDRGGGGAERLNYFEALNINYISPKNQSLLKFRTHYIHICETQYRPRFLYLYIAPS